MIFVFALNVIFLLKELSSSLSPKRNLYILHLDSAWIFKYFMRRGTFCS
jgi:hypothetical protein